MSKLWKFKALDSLFFRDGSPYNAGEGGQGQVAANFPPYMTTVQGAVRTALAAGQGWSPEMPGKWPEELGTTEDLGKLTLRGPYLFKGEVVFFPAPLLYLQKKDGEEISCTFLVPGEEIECDLGIKRLPQPALPLEGAKAPEGYWLTRSGLEKVLAGKAPVKEDMVNQEELWKTENRTGIELNRYTRTSQDSMIYFCVQVRPEKDVSLGVSVSGVPEDWHRQVPAAVRLGGEGRLAEIKVNNIETDILPPPTLYPEGGSINFTVVLITPGFYEDTRDVIENGPPGIPGKCISACIGRVQQVGGWDIANCCPRPLHPVIPAGSAWFYQAEEKELDNIRSLHGKCPGSKAEYGFGQIVIGCWRDAK